MTLTLPNNLLRSALLACGLILLVGPPASHAETTINHETVRLQSLNKSTARISTFETKIGETVKLGPLYIRPQACRTAPVTENPESAAFLQIWAAKPVPDSAPAKNNTEAATESEWIFSGWMFASSPGLSSMDHPVYDLWVLDCGGKSEDPAQEASSSQTSDHGDDFPASEEAQQTGTETDHTAAAATSDENMTPLLSEEPQEQGQEQNQQRDGKAGAAGADTPNSHEIETEEEEPIVIIDGHQIVIPQPSVPAEEQNSDFQSYDDDETDTDAPIVHLD
ncbi:MAG: DUF2155 domain-containing protein [Rhodospirillales bacterium]|nr:DUF2155 domain-containing protein [Rhodospirillales bacterium]MCB9964640.1 DUF2155 domain-containing protein [Rhodospirillales bacterium]MCB9979930.1 DUF2155 domain-containing protein [Rhodospirillales bacterium]